MYVLCILFIFYDWDIFKRKYMYCEINIFLLCGYVEFIFRLNFSFEDYEFYILGKGFYIYWNCLFSLYIFYICGSGKEEFLNLIYFYYMDIIFY